MQRLIYNPLALLRNLTGGGSPPTAPTQADPQQNAEAKPGAPAIAPASAGPVTHLARAARMQVGVGSELAASAVETVRLTSRALSPLARILGAFTQATIAVTGAGLEQLGREMQAAGHRTAAGTANPQTAAGQDAPPAE